MMAQRPRDLGLGCLLLLVLALISVIPTLPLCDHWPIYVHVCEHVCRWECDCRTELMALQLQPSCTTTGSSTPKSLPFPEEAIFPFYSIFSQGPQKALFPVPRSS